MLRLLLFSTPGGPSFEIGEHLAELYNLPYLTLEYQPNEKDSYFKDTIPAVYFDTNDMTSGSAQSQMIRDPESLQIERDIKSADPTIISPDTEILSDEEKFEIFQIEQGIISSQMADLFLCEWATQIIFLKSDINASIDWFSKRRHCMSCGAAYHLDEKPSKYYEICDRCGSQLTILPQDTPASMRAQFKEFKRVFWKFKEKSKQYTKYKEIDIDECADFNEICRKIDSTINNTIEDTNNWYRG